MSEARGSRLPRHAHVLLNMELGAERRVMDALREVPGVIEAWRVYGVYDAVMKVRAETPAELSDAVARLRRIAGVRSTLTLIPIEGFER